MRNLGSLDQLVRVVVGIVLLTLAFTGPQTAWGALGFYPLGTVMMGWCPLYALFGISTRPKWSHI